MIIANAKCKDCEHIYEIFKKNIMDDFVSGDCPKCKSNNTYRIFAIGGFDVCVGRTGNQATNYDNSFINHPSKFGKFKGKRIR